MSLQINNVFHDLVIALTLSLPGKYENIVQSKWWFVVTSLLLSVCNKEGF